MLYKVTVKEITDTSNKPINGFDEIVLSFYDLDHAVSAYHKEVSRVQESFSEDNRTAVYEIVLNQIDDDEITRLYHTMIDLV